MRKDLSIKLIDLRNAEGIAICVVGASIVVVPSINYRHSLVETTHLRRLEDLMIGFSEVLFCSTVDSCIVHISKI